MGCLGWSLIAISALLLGTFAVYRVAMAGNPVALLNWFDARFSRDIPAVFVTRASYGSDPHQTIEVWRPEGVMTAAPAPPPGQTEAPQRYPLVIFFHGGSWASGDPDDYRFVARALADRGYASALVGYRLGEAGRFPVMLEDSAAGFRWIVDNAERLGMNSDNITLMGHSAGAYNAVMLALDPRWLEREGLTPAAIKGVVGLSGPYDFYPFDDPMAIAAFGEAPEPRDTQPIEHVRGDAPALLLIAGGDDATVGAHNAINLDDAVRKAGGSSRTVSLDGVSHAGTLMKLARPWDRDERLWQAIIPFLGMVGLEHPSAAVKPPAG